MGCDIHQVFEKRDANGVWHTWPARPEKLRQRNYSVFGVLAGVRRDPGPGGVIAEPRGIPADFSMAWAGPDMIEMLLGEHSFSHLTALEILGHPLERWPEGAEWWREVFIYACQWTFCVDTTSLEQLSSFRMVFGFDS